MSYTSVVRTLYTIALLLHGREYSAHLQELSDWYWNMRTRKCSGCGE